MSLDLLRQERQERERIMTPQVEPTGATTGLSALRQDRQQRQSGGTPGSETSLAALRQDRQMRDAAEQINTTMRQRNPDGPILAEDFLADDELIQSITSYVNEFDEADTSNWTRQDAIDWWRDNRRWMDSNTFSKAGEMGRVFGNNPFSDEDNIEEDQLRNLSVMMDRWDRVSGAFDEGLTLGQRAEKVWENVWRGTLDPVNLIGGFAGKGIGKLGAFAANVATDAAITGAFNAADQVTRIEAGMQDEFDAESAMWAAGLGGLVSAPPSALAVGIGRGRPQPEVADATRDLPLDDIVARLNDAPEAEKQALARELVNRIDSSALDDPRAQSVFEHARFGQTQRDQIRRARQNQSNLNSLMFQEDDPDIKTLVEGHELERDMFNDVRRGSRPWQQAIDDAMADLQSVGRREAPKIKALTDDQLAKEAIILEDYRNLYLKTRTALEKEASDENAVKFAMAESRYLGQMEKMSGAASEAGRSLSFFNAIKRGMHREVVHDLNQMWGGVEGIRKRTQDVAEAIRKGDTRNIAKKAEKAYDPTIGDKIMEFYINGLLSGLSTQTINFAGGVTTTLMAPTEKLGGALMSIGVKDGVRFQDVAAHVRGQMAGLQVGLKMAFKAFREERAIMGVDKFEGRHQSISGLKGKLMRTPSRLLMGMDEFFKHINFGGEMEYQVHRYLTKTLQLSPSDPRYKAYRFSALRQINEDFVQGRKYKSFRDGTPKQLPHSAMEEIYHRAKEAGQQSTFTNDPPKAIEDLMRMTNRVKPLKLILPFIRTPSNIISYAFNRTPLGLLSKSSREALKEGGDAAALVRARVTMGTMTMGMAAAAAEMGLITGAEPTDRIRRQEWRDAGKQGFSVWGGTYTDPVTGEERNRWIQYGRMEPFGIIVGLAADMQETFTELQDETDPSAVIGSLIGVLSDNILSKTWMTGLEESFEALLNPERSAEWWAQRRATAFIPTIVGHWSKAIDPTLYNTPTVWTAMKAKMGMTEGLVPRQDSLGAPVTYETPAVLFGNPEQQNGFMEFFNRLVNPFYAKSPSQDPVRQELDRLNAGRLPYGETWNGVQLSPEEQWDRNFYWGSIFHTISSRIVNSEGWQNLPDQARIAIFDEVKELASRNTTRLMTSTHPDLFLKMEVEDLNEMLDPRVEEQHSLLLRVLQQYGVVPEGDPEDE